MNHDLIKQVSQALKSAPLAIRAARALGLEKKEAVICANQFICKHTHINLLQELGLTHLFVQPCSVQYFTPAELGRSIGISGKQFNRLLAQAGLQTKYKKQWIVTTRGGKFAQVHKTDRHDASGIVVNEVTWREEVIAVIKPRTYS